jgi:hypothetical protein
MGLDREESWEPAKPVRAAARRTRSAERGETRAPATRRTRAAPQRRARARVRLVARAVRWAMGAPTGEPGIRAIPRPKSRAVAAAFRPMVQRSRWRLDSTAVQMP